MILEHIGLNQINGSLVVLDLSLIHILPGGRWRTLCDGRHAQGVPFGPVRTGQMELPATSVVILTAVRP